MFRLLEIVLFVSTFICVTEGYGSCDQYAILRCMKPIYDLRHRLGISDSLKYFPVYKLTSQQLDDYCLDGDEAGRCLNNLVGCTSVLRNLFTGFLDSFDYLCKQTLDEYKTFQPCFAKPMVIPALQKCDQDTSKHLLSLRTDVFHNAESQICSIVEDDYSCIRNAMQPHCGTKAANWQVKYINTLLTPMLQQVGCSAKVKPDNHPSLKYPPPHAAADTYDRADIDTDYTEYYTGFPIWIYFLFGANGIVLLGLFVACCVVCANRRRRARRRAQKKANNMNHFHNVLASEKPQAFASDGKVV